MSFVELVELAGLFCLICSFSWTLGGPQTGSLQAHWPAPPQLLHPLPLKHNHHRPPPPVPIPRNMMLSQQAATPTPLLPPCHQHVRAQRHHRPIPGGVAACIRLLLAGATALAALVDLLATSQLHVA